MDKTFFICFRINVKISRYIFYIFAKTIFMRRIILLFLIISQSLHMNAETDVCDSVSYTIGGGQAFTIALNITPGLTSIIDSMDILWSICNTSMCYTDQGTIASFQNILQTDTIKACYDAYIYSADTSYFCHVCDSLLYNADMNSWQLLNPGNPTAIEETVSVLTSAFYPNPANEIIYFDYYLNKPAKLIMMDILGNQVKTIQLLGKGKQKVNISDLSKGIYFGNVIVNNEIVTIEKLIVK